MLRHLSMQLLSFFAARLLNYSKFEVGAPQLAEACRIHSSLVPAWRWMKSCRRAERTLYPTIKVHLGGFQQPQRLRTSLLCLCLVTVLSLLRPDWLATYVNNWLWSLCTHQPQDLHSSSDVSATIWPLSRLNEWMNVSDEGQIRSGQVILFYLGNR